MARGAREMERHCGVRAVARGLGVGVEETTVEVAKEQAMAGLRRSGLGGGWICGFGYISSVFYLVASHM